jgi:hypothetical protein
LLRKKNQQWTDCWYQAAQTPRPPGAPAGWGLTVPDPVWFLRLRNLLLWCAQSGGRYPWAQYDADRYQQLHDWVVARLNPPPAPIDVVVGDVLLAGAGQVHHLLEYWRAVYNGFNGPIAMDLFARRWNHRPFDAWLQTAQLHS